MSQTQTVNIPLVRRRSKGRFEEESFIDDEEKEEWETADHTHDLIFGEEEALFRGTCPMKAVLAAIVLAITGAILMGMGIAVVLHLFDEFIANDHYNRGYPFIAMGVICLLPGVWVLFIAAMAGLRVPGYSFQQIPQFESDDGSSK